MCTGTSRGCRSNSGSWPRSTPFRAGSWRGGAGGPREPDPRGPRRERNGATERVAALVAVRAPHLYHSLRCFCLAGFSLLAADVEAGADLPFAFEEHTSGGPAPL